MNVNEVIDITTTTVSNDNYYNDIEKYTQLIDTYGASSVIIAVFLVIVIAILIYVLKGNRKTNDHIIKQQQEMVNMLIESKKKLQEENVITIQKAKEPNIVEVFLNVNSSIKDILKAINEEIDTDRLSIYVFHNGVYSSHGLPFFKTSCICEIVKKNSGVVKNINSHTNLPLQMFDSSISYLHKHGKMIIENVEDDNNELVHNVPMLIGVLKNNAITSGVGIAIYDHDNNILGVLIAEFVDIKTREKLEEVEKLLISKAPALSPILEYSGIYNNTTTNT